MTRIKDLQKTKQPREKLARLGLSNLTTVELLALILSSGTKRKNVLSLSKQILKKLPLKKLDTATLADLTKLKGIGPIKAAKILASLELGKRAHQSLPLKKIQHPKDVLKELDYLKTSSREHLIAFYLNARHELIKTQIIAIGSLNQNLLEPRDVFATALILPCVFIILVHNHPSGDPAPSSNDKKFTKRLLKAADLLGITLVDHLIITQKDYFSFKEANLL